MSKDNYICLFCKSKLKNVNTVLTCTNCDFNYSCYLINNYIFHDFETEEFIITRLNF